MTTIATDTKISLSPVAVTLDGQYATYGGYLDVPTGAHFSTAAHLPMSLWPWKDRPLVVLHTVNDQFVGGSAEAFFTNHFTVPGDKTSSSGSKYGVAYHCIIDQTGHAVWALDEKCGPNAAGQYLNLRAIHVVMMCGNWSNPADPRCQATLRGVAEVFAFLADAFALPTTHLWVADNPDAAAARRNAEAMADMRHGQRLGFCSHHDATIAYKLTGYAPLKNTHTDPRFPAQMWDTILNMTRNNLGGNMATAIKLDDPADLAVFEANGSRWRWIQDWSTLTQMWNDGLLAPGIRKVPRSHLASYHLDGPAPADVYPQHSTVHSSDFGSHTP